MDINLTVILLLAPPFILLLAIIGGWQAMRATDKRVRQGLADGRLKRDKDGGIYLALEDRAMGKTNANPVDMTQFTVEEMERDLAIVHQKVSALRALHMLGKVYTRDNRSIQLDLELAEQIETIIRTELARRAQPSPQGAIHG